MLDELLRRRLKSTSMAMLDRLVDGSIIMKLKGLSYLASRSANLNQ